MPMGTPVGAVDVDFHITSPFNITDPDPGIEEVGA